MHDFSWQSLIPKAMPGSTVAGERGSLALSLKDAPMILSAQLHFSWGAIEI
jgi:hypothetical protein